MTKSTEFVQTSSTEDDCFNLLIELEFCQTVTEFAHFSRQWRGCFCWYSGLTTFTLALMNRTEWETALNRLVLMVTVCSQKDKWFSTKNLLHLTSSCFCLSSSSRGSSSMSSPHRRYTAANRSQQLSTVTPSLMAEQSFFNNVGSLVNSSLCNRMQ